MRPWKKHSRICRAVIAVFAAAMATEAVARQTPTDDFNTGIHAGDYLSGTFDFQGTLKDLICPPSPEAAALNRYVDCRVSYSTGTVGIEIPLLSWDVGDLNVSLGLSYMTSGHKTDELPSTVGLGWSLTGVGCVSRDVRCIPDEYSINHFFNARDCTTGDIVDFLKQTRDRDYDRYHYSVPGYSGSFYIMDGAVMQVPVSDVAVIPDPRATLRDSYPGFTIITPDGTRYSFTATERIHYSYIPGSYSNNFVRTDYTCLSTWLLTKIVAPERRDSVIISYTDAGTWRRKHLNHLKTFAHMWSASPTHSGPIPDSYDHRESQAVTEFQTPLVLSRIESRTGSVEFFTVKSGVEGPPLLINRIVLKNKDGRAIRNVVLGYTKGQLDSVAITSDGIMLDKRRFKYNPWGGGQSDFFGYPNFGGKGNTNKDGILDENGNPSANRKYNFAAATGGTVKEMQDAMGAVTTFDYEPSTLFLPRKSDIFGDSVVSIGVRIKSIVTTDKVSGRTRRRSFAYENPVPTVDLTMLHKTHFIARAGIQTTADVGSSLGQIPLYTLSASPTASCRLPGFPVENARIYYGRVRETVDGTGIDSPIVTDYRYDTSRCIHRFKSGRYGGNYPDNLAPDYMRYLVSRGGTHFDNLTTALPVSGHFQETILDNPAPLAEKTIYERRGNSLAVSSHTRYVNRLETGGELVTGIFIESLVRARDEDVSAKFNFGITKLTDASFFNTAVTWGRWFCDSVIETRHYPDGSQRRVVTANRYNRAGGWSQKRAGGKVDIVTDNPFQSDTTTFHDYADIPLLQSSVVSCNGESRGTYFCYSMNVKNSDFYAGVRARHVLSLPVGKAVVANKADTVMTLYEYGRFGGVTRPTRITLGRLGKRSMDSRRIIGYDSHGNPAGVSTRGMPPVLYTWDSYGNLLSTEVEGTGLRNRYEYIPLVGCSRVELSSGKIRNYSYTGGRLTGITDRFNQGRTRYSYALNAESPGSGNFVEEETNTGRGWMTVRKYFDGFGDNYLTYGIGLGGDRGNIMSATDFDAVGRTVRAYTPLAAGSRDHVMTAAQISATYASESIDRQPYSSVGYMAGNGSDRPVVTQAPGEELAGHPSTARYECNRVGQGEYSCLMLTFKDGKLSYSPALSGWYDVVRATDPDGHTVLTFSDFLGQKVLERRVLAQEDYLDTYYVYDPWGNPRLILQPEASAVMEWRLGQDNVLPQDVIDSYAFVYEYDESMRVVSKKLPGCEPVRFCYDRCGQLAFSQDGNLRDEGRRMFYLYDTAGRPTLTGLCDAPATWIVYTDTAMVSSRVDSPSIDKTYYSAPVAFGNPKMLNVWYYDTYPQLPGHSLDPNVTCPGLVAVSASALMPPRGDQDRLITVTYYDWDKRPAVVTTDIPGGGFVRTDTQFTLTDQVDSIWITTRMPGKPDIVDRYKYRYDHADRLKSVTYYHDDGAPVVLAVNGYDALGRLATAKLPGETVSYAYNVRDALTYISSPRFSQQLRYAAGAAAPCYNGNIAEAVTQGNKYAYTYDNANRLTSAKYTPSAGDADYSATYAYDRNSNITALTRKGLNDVFGNYGPVDDLTMLYDGNRLSNVTETADEVLLENSRDIKPIDPAFGDFLGLPPFSYDANGNTTRDITRKIYGMTYNALNLPQSATISSEALKLVIPSDASRIDYTYDGAGMKHQVVHTTVTKATFGNKVFTRTKRDTTRYVGSRIYENGQLDRVLTPYGYIKGGVHHTFLHDYQGNVAAVVAGDSLVQRTSYYPYGLPHANAHGATTNPYKYSGKEFDTFGGTDLYDFHARYHAPSTGRFMTVDPLIGKMPGMSPYIYCGGNPINYIDPYGLTVWSTSDQEAIREFIEQVKRNLPMDDEMSQYNMVGWDKSDTGQYRIDTDSKMLYYTTTSVEDGCVTITSHTRDLTESNQVENFLFSLSKASFALAAISAVGDNAGDILSNRSMYDIGRKIPDNRIVTVRTPVRNFHMPAKALKIVKAVGKGGGYCGMAITGLLAYNDMYKGNYYTASARLGVAAIEFGTARIPYGGPFISLGITAAECVWGDQFYEWVEENYDNQ